MKGKGDQDGGVAPIGEPITGESGRPGLVRNGVPLFQPTKNAGPPPDMELVNRLRDED